MTQPTDHNDGLAVILSLLTLGVVRFFVVNQGEVRIVTALGKLVRISQPGLAHCLSLWGLYERPSKPYPTKELCRDYEDETVFTRDGVECIIDTVVYFRIKDVAKAVFEVEEYEAAIRSLVKAILRNECGNLSARELLSGRKKLSEEIRVQLDVDTEPWGIKVRLVEIKGINIVGRERGAQA
jgi:regulator of protease activity HflC (stomatin/prohibitin superfamily)